MNQNIKQSLGDLVLKPEYPIEMLEQLRIDLNAHSRTRENLEYFLFTRILLLRREAAKLPQQQSMILHNQADALSDVLVILFSSQEENKKPVSNINF